MKWVKLARKKEIPYFDPLEPLKPPPIESIKCPIQPMLTLAPMIDPIEAEIKRFGKYWEDNFHWDLVSKQVAEVRMQIENPRMISRQRAVIWQKAQDLEIKNILRDRIGTDMEDLIKRPEQEEWDRFFVPNLERLRKADREFDAKMAWAVYYHDEIDENERGQRWDTRDREIADEVIDYAYFLMDFPWPQSWRCLGDLEDVPVTDEEWNSALENFPKALKAIQKMPDLHLERIKREAPSFWAQKKEEWRSKFEQELLSFKSSKEQLGGSVRHTNVLINSTLKKIKKIDDEINGIASGV
jgi:hypothetical protein